jgi:hypothetical protein
MEPDLVDYSGAPGCEAVLLTPALARRWLTSITGRDERCSLPPSSTLTRPRLPPSRRSSPSAAAVRLRRDFDSLLALIRAHAMLHQATRDRDDDGRIVDRCGRGPEGVRRFIGAFGHSACIPSALTITAALSDPAGGTWPIRNELKCCNHRVAGSW